MPCEAASRPMEGIIVAEVKSRFGLVDSEAKRDACRLASSTVVVGRGMRDSVVQQKKKYFVTSVFSEITCIVVTAKHSLAFGFNQWFALKN